MPITVGSRIPMRTGNKFGQDRGSPIPPIQEKEREVLSHGPTNRSGEGVSGYTTSHWTTTNRTARLGSSSAQRTHNITATVGVRQSFVAAGNAIASSAPGGKRSVSTSLKDSPSFQRMQTVKEHQAMSSGHSSVKAEKFGRTINTFGGQPMEITGEAASM